MCAINEIFKELSNFNFIHKQNNEYIYTDGNKEKRFLSFTNFILEMINNKDVVIRSKEDALKNLFVKRYLTTHLLYEICPNPCVIANSNEVFYQGLAYLVNSFVSEIKGRMTPIANNIIIGNKQLAIADTVEQIFFNHKTKELQIWMFDTRPKLNAKDNDFNFSDEINIIEGTYLGILSLKLALLKETIETNSKLRFGNSYICWMNEHNPNYKVYQAFDYSQLSYELLKHRFCNLIAA